MPPLTGITVADFSNLLPGPAATQNLRWLGAEIVKVEPPGGDPARQLYGGTIFRAFNRGKLSVELDLKCDADRDVARSLCQHADVVVEGFRPGVARRLGIDYDTIRGGRPDVVYCSISGWGQQGPRAAIPGHDLSFLARSGVLTLPGGWSTRHSGPIRPSLPIADLAGAAAATQAILAALLARQQDGGGRYLDVSIHQAVLHWSAARAGDLVTGEVLDEPATYLDPANDLFVTEDGGVIAVAAIEPRFWDALCAAISDVVELPEGAGDWDWRKRRAQGDGLAGLLADAFGARPRAYWMDALEKAGVPVDPVLAPDEAYRDPWVQDVDALVDGWLRPPLPFDGTAGPIPKLDQHGTAVRDRFGGAPGNTMRVDGTEEGPS